MKLIFLCICMSILFSAYHCKPMPGSTEEIATTAAPVEGKTAPPWLKFLKNKKTTANPLSTTESSVPLPHPVKEISGSGNKGKGVKSERAIDTIGALPTPTRSPTPSEMEGLANWLGIYLQPSGDILAQDRQQNPDSLYDEIYLDWMKRDLASQPQTQLEDVAPNAATATDPIQVPAPQPMLGYPAMPPYGYMAPFFPLAGLKMSKIMIQAQMDAAMAALNITTTPKPYKLKLKITVPGNADVAQIGQITTGISNSLPVGSTFELA